MAPSVDELLKLYEQVTIFTKQTGELTKKVNGLESKSITQQALLDIGLGFVVSKIGKDEFIKHLTIITESNGVSKEVKLAASEMLRQDKLWPGEQTLQ